MDAGTTLCFILPWIRYTVELATGQNAVLSELFFSNFVPEEKKKTDFKNTLGTKALLRNVIKLANPPNTVHTVYSLHRQIHVWCSGSEDCMAFQCPVKHRSCFIHASAVNKLLRHTHPEKYLELWYHLLSNDKIEFKEKNPPPKANRRNSGNKNKKLRHFSMLLDAPRGGKKRPVTRDSASVYCL